MKVLYTSERPPFPFFLGGAARSAHYILSKLACDHGVECVALGSAEYDPTAWACPAPEDYPVLGIRRLDGAPGALALDCGFPVRVVADYHQTLDKTLATLKPNLVWAQMEGAEEIFKIAGHHGIKGINFIRDAEYDPAELVRIARGDVHFICNSHFLAKKVQGEIGRPPSVIYPPLAASFCVTGDPDGYITMINAHPVKGVWTFLDIAERMPQQPFLLLESWVLQAPLLDQLRARLVELPNVTFMRRVSDMSTIYRKTKLLLVPSQWEEAFGRVVIEAQSCGIPVIASLRGGLPEAVGEGGLLVGKGGFLRGDYRQASAWIRPIKKILGSREHYQRLSRAARENAARDCFSAHSGARAFYQTCRQLLEDKTL